uniref:Ig-like domain-containing protein n=2 Tax=Astatotilapia calliptera TaxID=8154 RepID=A0A3P8QHZ4_ASTCA
MLSVRMLSFFILIFSLCDADSICPPEHNPLTLSPPEIIEEYGGNPVTVNCTTALAEHKGMYFTVGNETSRIIEKQMSISQSVSLSDWNVTIKCKVKLNEFNECSKDLQVITFKNPEVVHSVQLVNVIGEETQYRLQCDIINVAPVQYVTVSWYKNSEKIQTESFNDTTTKTPVNESSILRVNISREENVVKFRCEAQLDFRPHRPKLPAISKTHRVSAHYAPELKTQNSADDTYALEGTDIILSCEAVGNPLPVYNWICDGKNMLENTTSLSLPRVHGNKTCACTATNYLGNITKTIHLHVEPRGCPLTLTPSETVVKFGDPVSINCSTSVTDVEGMGWEAPFGGTGFERPPVVTWRVEKLEEWTPSPFCYVTLVNGSQRTVSPVITVYKTPDSVSVSDMGHGSMVEGREYDLKCDVINVAPVQNLTVTWYRGNETVLTQMFNDSTMTPVNASSTLRISTQRDYNGLTFRCEAELHLGPKGPKFPPNVTSPPYTAVVLYKPFMESCPDHVTVVENAAFSKSILSCQADGNPPPTVQWFYEGKILNSFKPLTRTDSGKYTAIVENSRGRSNTSVHITVEYSPSFTCKEHYEITVNDKHQSICEPVGLPTPTLTWLKDGKQMVSPQRWKKNDSGKYLLKAHNTHGTAEHTLYLEILYAPEFKEGNESKEVLQGENVTLSCSADSNPPSNITWIYTAAVNSNMTTEGHQKTVTITRATSTNAGYYICVAENKVGRNTRFITLMITGKSSQIPFPIIWVSLTLLIIILILLVVCCRICQKKRGHYSFFPVKVSNVSNIPLTSVQANGKAKDF